MPTTLATLTGVTLTEVGFDTAHRVVTTSGPVAGTFRRQIVTIFTRTGVTLRLVAFAAPGEGSAPGAGVTAVATTYRI